MSLELILGPMFAGKSSAILHIVNRHHAIGHKPMLISHSIDSRYSQAEHIVNHDGLKVACHKGSRLLPFLKSEPFVESKLVIVEEGQFFPDLYEFVVEAVDVLNKNVIVVGLDGDADRKPFGQILELIPLCDKITKLTAFCKMCNNGKEGIFTFCKKKKAEQVCVGGDELYMPLCRVCYLVSSSGSERLLQA
jgi:thymidine kinase